MDEPLDPSRLQLPDSTWNVPAKPKRLPRHRRGEEFLRGPIPLSWLCQASRLPGKTPAVALALWFKAGTSKASNPTVKLTGALRRRFGVGRKAASRALDRLETEGLVSVDRHAGRCPRVTILEAPQSETAGTEHG
jgi:DNA-binding MarR family transcriptional regulator